MIPRQAQPPKAVKLTRLTLLRGLHNRFNNHPARLAEHNHAGLDLLDRNVPVRRGNQRPGRDALIARPIGIVRRGLRVVNHRTPKVGNESI